MRNKKQFHTILCFTIIWVIFLALKLCGLGIIANWNWWWVSSPIWIPVVLLFVLFIYTVIVEALKHYSRKRRFEKKFNVK